MNLTLADAQELPLAAALCEGDDVLAATPEWRGAVPGTVAFPVRRTRLFVSTGQPETAGGSDAALLALLLAELDHAASTASGWARLQLRMLAASLRIVGGGSLDSHGSAADVIELAVAGIGRRSSLAVQVDPPADVTVAAPEVVALVLVQLAVNAERHDAAEHVRIWHDADGFHVGWEGTPAQVRTSRRRSERHRWGLGFARIAADWLGATIHPPRHAGNGTVVASLELGVARLALPLAAVRGAIVVRATRTWDEETGLVPACRPHEDARLADLVAAARGSPGRIVERGPMTARASRDLVWVAVPPDGAVERARDVIAGLCHEQALLHGADEISHATVRGLAVLVAVQLGAALPRAPAAAWSSRLRRLLEASGSSLEVPAFDGIGALDADATFVLALRGGAGFEVAGDQLWLRILGSARQDPAVRAFSHGGERIPLA